MKTAQHVKEAGRLVSEWKAGGFTVGLVPTMGYLHEGHESLMRAARERADKLVVSIFVNPAQFGPGEDLDRYPRDMDHDLAVCGRNQVDLIFTPSPEDMYPEGYSTYIDVQGLTEGLCGRSRPTHFRGVCTVVCKLFNILRPDIAFFGQKDAQQLAVIKRMTKDLHLPVEIVGCPIIREADGLAKSSRNAYLNAEERRAALSLSRSLDLVEMAVRSGERDSAVLETLILKELGSQPLIRPDYVEIVDAQNLLPVKHLAGETLVALAACVGKTRLIDNRSFHLSA